MPADWVGREPPGEALRRAASGGDVQESRRKGLVVMSGDDVKRKVSTPIVDWPGDADPGAGGRRGRRAGSWAEVRCLAQKGHAAKGAAGRQPERKCSGRRRTLSSPDPTDPWDPFREMRSLQAEMNEMFRQSIARFHSSPLMDPFKDDAGYSLSLDVRESKDRYEVRAFLPDAKASEANVKLEGNRLEVRSRTDNRATRGARTPPAWGPNGDTTRRWWSWPGTSGAKR